jgi:trigger factor
MTLKGIAPEVTDEWVKKASLVSTTVEEYREEHRAALENSNYQTYKYELEGEMWDALIKQCEVDEYPQDMIDAQYTALENMFASLLGSYKLDDLVQSYYGITAEEYACNIVKQLLAVEAISAAENITVTDEYYNAYLEEFAYSYGYDDLAEFETLVSKETLQQSCLNKRVGEFLIENSVVTTK